jgi:hypothetical protein
MAEIDRSSALQKEHNPAPSVRRVPSVARGEGGRSMSATSDFIPPPGAPLRSRNPPHKGAGFLRRRSMQLVALVIICLSFAAPPARAQGANPAAVAGLEGQHPAEYFRRAKELFDAGRKDDGVFAFYFGQLRYRRHLMARPNLPRDKDPALFAALMATIGPPINQYAFGDIRKLARSIDAVLAHDLRSPDQATPQQQFPQAHGAVRAGLGRLKAQILRDREKIRAARTKNGLENRT